MSHTLQTAITFPVLTGCIVFILTTGPIFYQEADISARLHCEAIDCSLKNTATLLQTQIQVEDRSIQITCASPEKMHFLVRAVCDSAILLLEGVDVT